jgi:2-succinyl-6-hydroxy-2,4-cyclohexadiene-1-carboxylate synthase
MSDAATPNAPLAVTVFGAAEWPPLLLLHGFTGSAVAMSDVATALGACHEVLVPDLVGHGKSHAPAGVGAYSADAQVRHLREVVGRHQTPMPVVGYSMGARLALTFAVAAPELVSSLVLIGGTAGIAEESEREARRRSDETLADMIEREGVPAFVDYWESLPLFASQRSLSADRQHTIRAGRLTNTAAGLANSLRGFGAGEMPSVWHCLGDIAVPTLVIAGSLDTKYVALSGQLVERLPNAKALVVDGVGHAVHTEAQRAVVEAILAHLGSGNAEAP